MKPLPLFLLLSLAVPLAAAPEEFTRKAQDWMQSTDSSKRQAAFRSWMQLGAEEMDHYEDALEAAEDCHLDRLNQLCEPMRASSNPYLEHQKLAEELDEERQRVMGRIRTDWKKEPREIKKLEKDVEGVEKMVKKIRKAAEIDTGRFDQAIDAHLTAAAEIRKEREQFEEEPEDLDLEEIRDEFIDDNHRLSDLEDMRRRLEKTRKEVTKLAEVEKANDALPSSWAKPAMKDFASILNHNRSVLGLVPLLLEEKLSDAAKGHSEDMERLGFFAHESPVPGKKTPWDRAAKAGFQWAASGENIYMGSTSPSDAYTAWFHSDGHRFIMMASGPNLLGVGLAGKHWTMMTGTR
ncbi:CAP domain-containing protein [Haloferula sargassicola]|uniref:SCP domain-containing protein n=1 Tax=Haloferula sargassicola TaxID=490096 RepID=A0ABP9UN83_9BACT